MRAAVAGRNHDILHAACVINCARLGLAPSLVSPISQPRFHHSSSVSFEEWRIIDRLACPCEFDVIILMPLFIDRPFAIFVVLSLNINRVHEFPLTINVPSSASSLHIDPPITLQST